MTDICLTQLVELRNAAHAEMTNSTAAMKDLVKQLQEGVSYKEACEVANRFWPVREASEIKLRLFDSFPKENGQVILNKGLDKRISDTIATEQAQKYFEAAGVYISEKVQAILDDINSKNLACQDAAFTLNTLKAQVSRYMGFVNWGVYEIKTQLLDPDPKQWGDLSPSVESVENGDYLFLENIPNLVDKAHAKFIEENFPYKYSLSLGDVDWRSSTLGAVTELSLLFAAYLENFVDMTDNREVTM
jgi:hypothetical protein